jgi:riboflavin kinase/FMN adenylyltransferase
MRILRGFQHLRPCGPCALTIGNFDGVHRGHQAVLALLKNEARHRGLPATVMTFLPHPREFFTPQTAPARISNLRDKLAELTRCGIDQVVLMRFNAALAAQSPQDFIEQVLVQGLNARYVLVGDDFRFGAKRAGDYALLDAAGKALQSSGQGFEVARMLSYEVDGLRVSSSTVRECLSQGDMARVAQMSGRPYSISGHVLHGRKLGRELGFPTLNVLLPSAKPATMGIFVVRVHGLGPHPLPGVASLGVRPTVEDNGRVLLETHVLDWQGEAYGKIIAVDLLHKLHDERRYAGLDELTAGIRQDVWDARDYFRTQTP